MSFGDPERAREGHGERQVKRAVVLAGATGLAGRSILERLLADPSVQVVHVLGRRKPRVAHARIMGHIVDFAALPPLPPVDEVYLALGTTIRVAGSQATFGRLISTPTLRWRARLWLRVRGAAAWSAPWARMQSRACSITG